MYGDLFPPHFYTDHHLYESSSTKRVLSSTRSERIHTKGSEPIPTSSESATMISGLGNRKEVNQSFNVESFEFINQFDTYGLLEAVEEVNNQVRNDRDWEHMVGRAVLEEEE